MKDLTQWLVTRLQTAKQADAVVAGALPHAAIDAIEASRYIPFSQQNPLLSGIRHHYTAAEGGRDLVKGIGRSGLETARAILPFAGHGGFNSVGDNFLQATGRTITAPALAAGSYLGGDAAAAKKTMAGMFDGWDSKMISEPFVRAGRNPDGYGQSLREMGGLFQRWQPKVLYGDTLSSHPTIGKFLPGGEPRPFWNKWLGLQHIGAPMQSTQSMSRDQLAPGVSRPPHF